MLEEITTTKRKRKKRNKKGHQTPTYTCSRRSRPLSFQSARRTEFSRAVCSMTTTHPWTIPGVLSPLLRSSLKGWRCSLEAQRMPRERVGLGAILARMRTHRHGSWPKECKFLFPLLLPSWPFHYNSCEFVSRHS